MTHYQYRNFPRKAKIGIDYGTGLQHAIWFGAAGAAIQQRKAATLGPAAACGPPRG
jgi:hypothetical protein